MQVEGVVEEIEMVEKRGTVRETGNVLMEEKERGKSYGGDGGGNDGRARGSGKLDGCWR